MTRGFGDGRIAWRIVSQIASDKIVEVRFAYNSESRRKVFFDGIEQPVKVHISVNLDAVDRGYASLTADQCSDTLRRKIRLGGQPLLDAAGSSNQSIEKVLQLA